MTALVCLARNNLKRSLYVIRHGYRNFSQKAEQETPVKFSTSEAAGWRAEFTRSGNLYDDSPYIQPFVVSISTAIFLLYFFYLREESDLDQRVDITADIYSKVEGLEEVNLRTRRQEMLNAGKNVREVDNRLQELELERLEKSRA